LQLGFRDEEAMSDKDRRKKQGERKDKKRERMRKAVQERQANGEPRPSTDQVDLQRYKPGSPLDRNWQRVQEAEPPGRATKATRPRAR
jgi:hypothetical protein